MTVSDSPAQLARVEDHGDHLLIINANTKRRNALSPAFYDAIISAVTRANAAPQIAALIIWGEGGFFCSGGDLTMLAARRELSLSERASRIEHLHTVIRAIRSCRVPIIAAVDGGAAGAGLSIALACDLIVAAEDAKFTASYVKAGLVPDGGLTHTLTRALPHAVAMQMLLLGDSLTAERFFKVGLISELTPAGESLATALKTTKRLCEGAGQAQVTIKALVSKTDNAALFQQLDLERDAMAKALGAPEAGEGISAFLEKRTPDFQSVRATLKVDQ
ncbi:oxepin-CoA hydrolase, alternative type [Roseibium algae]|uniref:Enoyl-CoA hydratase family protein n=1 Tax=Roseibium algae TaxID=3123038 RepID=A0ABU8TNZ1_9HYPH